jgi:probable HAF family extracellular repeat protein
MARLGVIVAASAWAQTYTTINLEPGYAEGINNSGQVAGYAETGSGDSHAFLCDSGSMIGLGALGSSSAAFDISQGSTIFFSFFN